MVCVAASFFTLSLSLGHVVQKAQGVPHHFPPGPPYHPALPGDGKFQLNPPSSAMKLLHFELLMDLTARSACPGLNAMANHGWLPHDGRNITLSLLSQALIGAFAFDKIPPPPGTQTFAQDLFAASIRDPANAANGNMSFDLDTINTHNGPIEFDGSLSRKDHFFGSDVDFDPKTWDTQWRLFEQEGFLNDTYIDLPVAATARAKHVLLKSQAGNPEFLFTQETLAKSSGTTALYLMVLGGVTGLVNKDWVWAFFAEERIPYKEGFSPRDNVSIVNLGPIVDRVIAAAPTNLLCSFNPDMFCPGN